MSFNVKVKFFGRAVGSELIQSVSPDMTIRALKQALAERVDDGVSPDRLKLIYLGRVMADDHTVGQYGVAENQVLHMVVKPADTAEQPARPQPSTEPAAAAAAAGQQPDPFAEAAGGPAGGLGGGAMGGLFQGLFQNLSAATPLMHAAIHRAQQAAQHQPAAAAAGGATAEELPRSANRSPAPEAGSAPAQAGTVPSTAAPQHHVFVNTMAAQAPPPPSNVFHVHVHVTMDELRELPERLTAFNTRMARAAPNAQIHVQTTAGAPNARAAAAHAAAHPNPGQSRPPAASNAAPTAATTPADPTLAEVQAAAGVPAAECKSITKVLQESVVKDAGMGEVMALASGDWSAVEKTRAPLRALAMRRCNGNPTPALRAELVEEAVIDAVEKLEANAEAQQQIRSRVRTGVNVSAFVRAAARGALRALLDLALDGHRAPHASFPQAFRAATVRNIGHSLHFAERNVARNGAADVDAILQVAVQMAVREATTARPDLAGVAGMVPMMVLPTLRGWQEEYARAMRRPSDDGNLEMEIRRNVACSTRNAAPAAVAAPAAAPAAAAAADDDDAVLDAALNEAGAPNAPAASNALPAALSALPQGARERITRDAAADTQAVVSPPPKHYFAGERHDALE